MIGGYKIDGDKCMQSHNRHGWDGITENVTYVGCICCLMFWTVYAHYAVQEYTVQCTVFMLALIE